MQLEYDLSVGALYVRLSDSEIARTREVDDNTNVDLDASGGLVGIEVLALDEPWPLADILSAYPVPDSEMKQVCSYFFGQLQASPRLGIARPAPAKVLEPAAA